MRQACASACSSSASPDADPLGGVDRRRSRRALHRAVRACVRAGPRSRAASFAPLRRGGRRSRTRLGLGVNAGHDLDLANLIALPRLCRISTRSRSATRSCRARLYVGLATSSASISRCSLAGVGAHMIGFRLTHEIRRSRLRNRRDPVRPHRRLDHRIAAGTRGAAAGGRSGRAAGGRIGRRPRHARRGARRDPGQRAQDGRRDGEPRTRRRARSSATSTSTPSATTMRSSGMAMR